LRIIFLQPAERELDEAVDYYEAQKTGLGFAFVEAVWVVIERIERYPEAWQLLVATLGGVGDLASPMA